MPSVLEGRLLEEFLKHSQREENVNLYSPEQQEWILFLLFSRSTTF